MRIKQITAIMVIILLVSGLGRAAILTVQAVADNAANGYVRSKYADKSYTSTKGSHGFNIIEIDQKHKGNGQAHGLLAFTDLIGNQAGQLAPNSNINSAALNLWYVNDNKNADVYFYRMTESWDKNTTWNSLGGGVKPGSNAASNSLITANFGKKDPVSVSVDVTQTINEWLYGADNFGWGIVNSSSNGFQFAGIENCFSKYGHAPTLIIDYSTPISSAASIPEPITITLLSLGSLIFAVRSKRR